MKINVISGISVILWSFLIFALVFIDCDKDPTPPDDDPADPPDTSISHFEATLSGDNEVPPVVTSAQGKFMLLINKDSTGFVYRLEIENAIDILSESGAHLHCGVEGVNGPIVIHLTGATPGGFDGSFGMSAERNTSDIVDTSCGDSILEFIRFMKSGNIYVNVHSTAWPGGEIRGQVVPVPVSYPR